MAIGLRPWVVNLIIVVLFATFTFIFAYSFLQQNNPSSEVLTQYGLANSTSSLNSTLNEFNDQITGIRNELSAASASPTTQIFLIFEQAFTIPKAFLTFGGNSILVLINIISQNVSPPVVIAFGIIASIMLSTLVFLIIKAIRTGESER